MEEKNFIELLKESENDIIVFSTVTISLAFGIICFFRLD